MVAKFLSNLSLRFRLENEHSIYGSTRIMIADLTQIRVQLIHGSGCARSPFDFDNDDMIA